MTRLSRAPETLKPSYDVVVVGSGYGGGVAASRLARAGLSVCVLERGREFLTGEFPSRFPELRAEFQLTGKHLRTGRETALYDVRIGEDMHVLVGCGVGGGSLVNAGVALRPDARVFADEIWPGQIRQDGLLAQGYARAENWLRPTRHEGSGSLTKVKALHSASGALGKSPVTPPVVVSFEETVNPAGIRQPACTLCGDCCGGCNVGAKNTVALTYLPDAVRHGAEIYAAMKVSHVAKSEHGGWRVHVRRSDTKGDATISISAQRVVLAAGTLGSTEILHRSRDKGLALSDQLGRRFSANGDIIAFGYGADIPVSAIGVGHPPKIDIQVGAAVSAQIEIKDEQDLANCLTIQEGVLPSAIAPVLPVMFVPNGRLLGALQSLVSGVYKGPFASLQTFFAVSHDSAAGQLVMDGDRLRVAWPGAEKEPVYKRLDDALSTLVGTAGGKYVKNPLAGTVMGHQPATAHPLGGCGMGHDKTSGVVDHKCRVFDGSNGSASTAIHEGLYVIDGSIIPRSLGVNPLLTITALAERALLHMRSDLSLTFDDAPLSPRVAASPQAPLD